MSKKQTRRPAPRRYQQDGPKRKIDDSRFHMWHRLIWIGAGIVVTCFAILYFAGEL